MGQSASASDSSITFFIHHDPQEAQRLLDTAEQTDFYSEECREDHANALARKGMNYRSTGMTPREYKFFEIVVENAKGQIPRRLERDLREVHLIQLDRSADGGMPHTRPGGLICYPDIGSTFSVSTLIHELWHVHQREHAEWWRGVFQRLGWEAWKGVLPTALETHRRINPDTIDEPLWCFRQTWVPVPLFRDVAAPRVTEVTVWFYHVSLKYHVKQVPKEMEAEYYSLPHSAYEHPREIAAYLLSDPVRYASCPAIASFAQVAGMDAFPPDLTE